VSGTVLFLGRVLPGGLLVLDKPRDYNRHVRAHAGQYVEVTLRKRRQKRSPQANRFYWGYVLEAIAEATGYTKYEAHDALKFKFLREDGDGPLVKVRSSAELSVEEFSVYTERVMVFGAETFGIVWMDREQWEAA
jgi:hypothetical protein